MGLTPLLAMARKDLQVHYTDRRAVIMGSTLASFCVDGEPPPTKGGPGWLRFALAGNSEWMSVNPLFAYDLAGKIRHLAAATSGS